MAAELIRMNSTGKTKKGKSTGTFYTTKKDKRTHPEKMKMKRYDRRAYDEKTDKCGVHVVFEEGKIK